MQWAGDFDEIIIFEHGRTYHRCIFIVFSYLLQSFHRYGDGDVALLNNSSIVTIQIWQSEWKTKLTLHHTHNLEDYRTGVRTMVLITHKSTEPFFQSSMFGFEYINNEDGKQNKNLQMIWNGTSH